MIAAATAAVRPDEGSTTWARSVLADQGMPRDEIAAVLASAEPGPIHRYLELHAERLQERLAAQLGLLAEVERAIAEAASARRSVA